MATQDATPIDDAEEAVHLVALDPDLDRWQDRALDRAIAHLHDAIETLTVRTADEDAYQLGRRAIDSADRAIGNLRDHEYLMEFADPDRPEFQRPPEFRITVGHYMLAKRLLGRNPYAAETA